MPGLCGSVGIRAAGEADAGLVGSRRLADLRSAKNWGECVGRWSQRRRERDQTQSGARRMVEAGARGHKEMIP